MKYLRYASYTKMEWKNCERDHHPLQSLHISPMTMQLILYNWCINMKLGLNPHALSSIDHQTPLHHQAPCHGTSKGVSGVLVSGILLTFYLLPLQREFNLTMFSDPEDDRKARKRHLLHASQCLQPSIWGEHIKYLHSDEEPAEETRDSRN